MVDGKVSLSILRALALVVAFVSLGLGIGSQCIIQDMKNHRPVSMDNIALISPEDVRYWREYVVTVLSSMLQIYVSIGASSFASLAIIFVMFFDRKRQNSIPNTVIISLDTLSMCAMAAAFGTSLGFAAKIRSFNENRISAIGSRNFAQFAVIIPLSKGYVVLTCIGWFLTLMAYILAFVTMFNRARVEENDSFRPTASALGMTSKCHDIVPQTITDRVPSMYDPQRPLRAGCNKACTDSNADKPRVAYDREQTLYEDPVGVNYGRPSVKLEPHSMALLSPEKPTKTLQLRPTRPWRESPLGRKQYDDEVESV